MSAWSRGRRSWTASAKCAAWARVCGLCGSRACRRAGARDCWRGSWCRSAGQRRRPPAATASRLHVPESAAGLKPLASSSAVLSCTDVQAQSSLHINGGYKDCYPCCCAQALRSAERHQATLEAELHEQAERHAVLTDDLARARHAEQETARSVLNPFVQRGTPPHTSLRGAASSRTSMCPYSSK